MFATRRMLAAASTAFAALALTAASTASVAGAQQARLADRPAAYVRAGAPIPTVGEARRLAEEGRPKEALKAYTTIVENARITNDYPRESLEAIGHLKYGMDDLRGAAQAFEELGGQAEIFGDPETELTSRYRAALLYQETRDRRGVALQVARIKFLLKSPVVSAATRDAIAARISG